MASDEYEQFRNYLDEESFEKAIQLGERQLIDENQSDEFWLTHLSRAHLRAKHYDQALEYAQEALQHDSNNGFAILARAKAFRSLKKYERAQADFEDALSYDRVHGRAQWGLVETLIRMDEWQAVLDRLTQWDFPEEQTLRWKLRAYSGLEQYEKARNAAEQLLDEIPDDPQTLWELVEVEIENEGLESVKRRYSRMARIPSKPRIYREIYASLLRRAGDEEAAAEEYAKLEADDTDPSIQRRRAFTLAKSGREDEAIPLMEELLRQEPDDYYVHSAYRAACDRSSDLERAWAFYGELLRIHPEVKSLYGRRKKIVNELEHEPDT